MAGSATTDSNGTYTISGLALGTYATLTPSKNGYNFTPARRAVNVSGNVTGQDFRAIAITPFLDLPFSDGYDGSQNSFKKAMADTDYRGE